MQVGDIVLIAYEGKCKPGSYRLGIVNDVEMDEDGFVHTVTVSYSLLAEMSKKDHLSYTGITKKTLRTPVQRLVLILPIKDQTLSNQATSNQETSISTCSNSCIR